MVGEQPGDREDIEGRPFVGPAGRVLDQALERVGIDRDLVYVTNVVKHFKWRAARQAAHPPEAECRGDQGLPPVARRGARDACSRACSSCLGSTAAQALLGRQFRVTRERGRFVDRRLPSA